MSTEQQLSERLGIDNDVIATKCSSAIRFLLERKLFGNKTQEEFIDHMSGTFTPNELLFLAIDYITDKTAKIMKTDSEIEKIVDNVAAKHGVDPVMLNILKSTMGIKNSGSHHEEDNV